MTFSDSAIWQYANTEKGEPKNLNVRSGAKPKVYKGWVDSEEEIRVTVHGKSLRHVNYHSPDGFAWGYKGSAPADLALSILANYFHETWVNGGYIRRLKLFNTKPKCLYYHQAFKRSIIARWKMDAEWTLTSDQITE